MPKKFNNNFSRYNDGVVKLYREKERKSDFNAKRNVATLDDMEFIVRLDFEGSEKREQDITFAEQNSFSLTLKIKTRLAKNVDNKCKAVINGYLYDVQYIDKTKTEMFLFLEGVKAIDS